MKFHRVIGAYEAARKMGLFYNLGIPGNQLFAQYDANDERHIRLFHTLEKLDVLFLFYYNSQVPSAWRNITSYQTFCCESNMLLARVLNLSLQRCRSQKV